MADMTLLAWVKLIDPYPDGEINRKVLVCDDNSRSGFVVRIDRQMGKLSYRPSRSGKTSVGSSRASIENGEFHLMAVTREGNRVTLAIDGRPEESYQCDSPDTSTRPLTISSTGQFFQGVIAELVLLDHSLSGNEILERDWADAQSARARLDLMRDQCAVTATMPLTLRSTAPVYLHVSRYARQRIELVLSASSPASSTVRDGDFRVAADAAYRETMGTRQQTIRSDGRATCSVPVPGRERVEVRIEPAPGR